MAASLSGVSVGIGVRRGLRSEDGESDGSVFVGTLTSKPHPDDVANRKVNRKNSAPIRLSTRIHFMFICSHSPFENISMVARVFKTLSLITINIIT